MVCTTYKNCDLGDGWVLFYPHYTRSMKNLKMCRVDQNQHHPTPKDLEVTGRLCRIYSSSSWKNMSICLGKWCWPHGDLMVKNNPSRNFQNSEMGSILTIFHDFSSLSVQQRGPPGLRCACFKDLSTSNPLMFIFRYVWTCSVPLLFWSIGQLYTHISLSTIHFFGGFLSFSVFHNSDVAMDQYLLIPFLVGMNIHLPAILGWTTGVPGFDPLPCLSNPVTDQRLRRGFTNQVTPAAWGWSPRVQRPIGSGPTNVETGFIFLRCFWENYGKLWKTMENYGKVWFSEGAKLLNTS